VPARLTCVVLTSHFPFIRRPKPSFLSVLLRPRLRLLEKLLPIILVIPRNSLLNRIVRLRLLQQLLCKRQHRIDLRGRLPLVRTQHAETHAAFFIVGDVGVVDFGFETEGRGFEWVFFGEAKREGEDATLSGDVSGEQDQLGEESVLHRESLWGRPCLRAISACLTPKQV